MIVIDASVTVQALVYTDGRGQKARAALGRDIAWVVPVHWMAEVFSALRGLALAGKLTDEQAARALRRLPELGVERVPLDALLPVMWRMRAGITGYDAAYVALAQARGSTFVTADARLARAATAYCRVELAI